MTILIFIDWFKPAYKAGGPVQSISNLVSRFSTEVDFKIVTSDRDLGETKPFENVRLNQWVTGDGCDVIYLSPENQTTDHYKKLIQETGCDIIYINSIFSKNFAILPLMHCTKLNIKTILAPRGMLGEGALAQGKLKKKLFLRLFKIKGIHKKVIWHATAVEEEVEIKSVFGERVEIRRASNFPSLNMNENLDRIKKTGRVRLFFMSRVSPKKNLKFALQVLSKVKGEIQFDIIGPIDDGQYWEQCQSTIDRLPNNISVNYIGSIKHDQISEVLKPYHFFFLPTKNENFGHVIIEALSNACPVILSDQTPWKNLSTAQVGWDISLNSIDSFVKAINETVAMHQDEYSIWSKSAYRFADKVLNDEKVLFANRELFELN